MLKEGSISIKDGNFGGSKKLEKNSYNFLL